ncbi:MAG: S9 family peptidase, partial [Phenylobacterium sp.]|nr:S9 family peptidase [Phenylobacterium sp.]
MRLAGLAAAAMLAMASGVQAQIAEAPTRTFGARDLFGLQQASDPQMRPDGGAVAYVRASNDIMSDNTRRSIWLVDLDSGAQSPIAAEGAANLSPRWSPDGSRLAYVSAGAQGAQLYVRWVATGRTARVASLEQAPNDIAWSPDGKTLAFSMLTLDEGR